MQLALGAMLKAYRVQHALSQADVAAAMGWGNNVSRLSRYEQGRITPSTEILEDFSVVLGLAPDERGALLMEAGCLPNDEEVTVIWGEVRDLIETWPGPAVLMDFSWRAFGGNRALAALWGLTPEEVEYDTSHKLHGLELHFNPSRRQRLTEEQFQAIARGMIARFKANQKHRTGQAWYRDLLKRLMGLPQFRELWHSTLAGEPQSLTNYWRDSGIDERFDFHVLRSPLAKDPRFATVLRLPANEATAQHFAPFITGPVEASMSSG